MKKKGFTLIELLAVIIILAVVALIATPVVLNIIEKVRIKAAESSAKGYAKAVEYEILNDTMFKGVNLDGEYDVIDNTIAVKYQGDGPSKGYFILSKNTVTYGEFCINGYPIKYENSIGKYAPDEIDCGDGIKFVEPEGEKCTDIENYDEVENIKIKTVEDLVCVSNLSNNGKNFSGKIVSLLADLDINDDNSYNDINDTTYGDINGNGTVEGIKVELTTASGFRPIANFSGTFEGYGYTLSNLMINRSGTSYVGIFGNLTSGLIRGININNVNIKGNSNVGGVVGYFNSGTINEISINGNITGGESVGGVIGYNNSTNNIASSVLVNANVTGTNYVGGMVGYNFNDPKLTGVIETGVITSNDRVGKIGGRSAVEYGYASTLVKLSGTQDSNKNGTSYTLGENILSGYDGVLDTWIGGDNDSSGYYFDYDKNNEIVVKSVELDPITFTLKGEGTKESPYIIDSYQQWKEATTKVRQSVYIKLNTNIDFSEKPYYAMGTGGNGLVATLDGGYKTLSNVSVNGVNNLGIAGYNNGGTIKGLNVDNIIIKGVNNLGGIVGYNASGNTIAVNVIDADIAGGSYIGGIVGWLPNGSINEVTVNGTMIGSGGSVGGVVGYNDNYSSTLSALASNVEITGTSRVGGIAGAMYYGTVDGVVESGSITTTEGSSNSGKAIGYGYGGHKGRVYTTDFVSAPHGSWNYNGTGYSYEEINDLGYYKGFYNKNSKLIIETEYSGDVNGTGYYFGYGKDGYIRVVPVGGIPDDTPNNPTPDNPEQSDLTFEIDSNYTMTNIVGTTDTEAPTCELYYVRAVKNGIQASFSCTDNSGAPTVRSLFDSTTEKSAATFDTIGTLKSGSVSGNTKNVLSTWNIYNKISQPTPGTCYYFRYGGQDAQGNFSTYVTNICYTGFSN